ncbi:tRNA preQ1(34) S-adenosylmethionine ribosyltransferase-isomerase QueA [Roseobacter sp. HKCCA0434]|uniref:tRNA preQ1(34) S-adenosylmethionine ribosyltransferase-isomerase QueA n=1 Tax=Roseobacter sp. HKCCA0434 TaxID=3079297 RepID=UPI002905CD19|nr:tRNA preQ1(34) S-adenosylmethionine ribosyltransferase-isomerase QueA [Roseobacter sp. HKCCA0434]
MRLSDFDFDLPEELIALRPLKPRPASRLLLAEGTALSDRHVSDLPEILRPGDLMVFNDTKVIPARLFGTRTRDSRDGPGTAKVEATLLERLGDDSWSALARPGRKLRAGDVLDFRDLSAELVEKGEDGRVTLRFDRSGADLDAAIALAGEMPLPPYIAGKRPADDADREDYQTVFAEKLGAVAAPTASLHFDRDLLDRLAEAGVESTRVTLHVGAGTFLPVTVDDVSEHRMHAEWGEVGEEAAETIAQAKAEGRRVIPVGTTALRLIETAGQGGTIAPWVGDTDIFITPGYRFRVADGLMTNFHLPRSTLMMLVSALMGVEEMRAVYAHAIAARYRFYSYGDSSLLLPQP